MKNELIGEILFHPDLTPEAVERICEWIKDLKEKAEKWDKLETSELLHDIIVNASKLEAVKKYLDTIVIPSVSDITYLKKILEDEG